MRTATEPTSVVSTRLPLELAERLRKSAAANERTPAQELRLITKKHFAEPAGKAA